LRVGERLEQRQRRQSPLLFTPQIAVAAHPYGAVGGSQQTADLLSKNRVAEPAVLEAQEGIYVVGYPEAARVVGWSKADST
jgi:hypothetical protein